MKVLVVGATGGSGRAVVQELIAKGHTVTVLVRKPEALAEAGGIARVVTGDVMRQADVDEAVRGQDAVIVTLGIRENALKVRLRGSSATPMNVRSAGTARVIEAMQRYGVRKLVVQSSFGIGETRSRLPLKWRLIFALLLKPQIADTEVQERYVRASGLDWVIAQPVALTDGDEDRAPLASPAGEVQSMAISRRSLAKFLLDAAERPVFDRQGVSLS